MFEVDGFYDGYHLLPRFLPEEGFEPIREAVVGCSPYHPRYEAAGEFIKANRAERGEDVSNPTHIPESDLFTLIREVIKTGCYVEFLDWTDKGSALQQIEVDIVRYDGSPEGYSQMHRIVTHEMEAAKALRMWLNEQPGPEKAGRTTWKH